ncbi:FAD-binding oxidoreductase [Mesorhizobium sp. M1B.F.Ca.ET.045.04.1.1]|uniref:FAD-binding oxidoreductase n=1 Tax=Mesorhizobium sp. M1B.F.Ca.ET.045.04.1.1 TaxID=2493673 RepID=UPI000F7636FA|nr:FAD-binding oxidoreductase [Mesorhizobium sp. M1B.F.Ca.ET.045.04.1.1]AZO31435.1 FAD-binding oxidoreductase [Mesorhizobium sp. M1B.F.Ca.ET.045.04.1.1]
MGRDGRYRSWGRPPATGTQGAVRLHWRDEQLQEGGGPFLPYGNGRSYGDSCLNSGGTLVDLRGLDRFISFEADTGVLRCETGVLLSDILGRFVPKGWFLPVTPGTQQVTVGGAIANDVHGKNHHWAGSFGHHVRRFELLRSDGSRLLCSPRENADWFGATIGGLGLTGVILWAEIALKRIDGPAIEVESLRFSRVEEFLELSSASHNAYEYTVAWIDSLAPGPGGARGLFFRGNHAAGHHAAAPSRRKPGLPFTPPVSLLPRAAVGLFNTAVYRRPRRKRAIVHYEPFFYPLDAVPNWNRLFGRKGFYQYQCVIPQDQAEVAIGEIIARVARAREGSFLSVLKVFGNRRPPGWLSFSRPGTTLAFDFPDRGRSTLALLDTLDEITDEAGGAVYPAKDARMKARIFERGYPALHRFERYRDPAFTSDFWRRVTSGDTRQGAANA